MRRVTIEQKQGARQGQKHTNAVVRAGGFATVAVAAIPGAGPLIALAPAAVTALLMWKADTLGDLAFDPPRQDFEEASQPAEPRLQLDVLHESPIGESTIPLLTALDEATRLQGALIVAVERSQGAELAGDFSAASARQNEAYLWAERTATQLADSSSAAVSFAHALDEYRDTPMKDRFQVGVRQMVAPDSLFGALPAQTLDLMRHARIFPEAHQLPRPGVRELVSDRPVRTFISALQDGASADKNYAEFLQVTVRERALFEQSDNGSSAGQSPMTGGQDSGSLPA